MSLDEQDEAVCDACRVAPPEIDNGQMSIYVGMCLDCARWAYEADRADERSEGAI